MAYDSLVLSAVVDELNKTLLSARIEKIHQPAKHDVVILFHSPKGKYKLVLSADARLARAHLSQHSRENPLTPPLFCMVLRKHLEGGRLIRISQPDFERVLHLHIESMDELGRLTEKVLICEIMGKHSNVVLIDSATDTILDAAVRFTHAVNRYREILPGKTYVSPPTQGKLNPLEVVDDRFKQLLWAAAVDEKIARTTVEKWLLNTFTGLSPQTCREIYFRSGLALSGLADLGEYEMQTLWEAFTLVIGPISANQYHPTIVRDSHGQVTAFSAIDLLQYEGLTKEHDTMNGILDLYYQTKFEQMRTTQIKDRLMKVVSNELTRNQKKLAIQEETIAEAEKADKFRVLGELITANLHLIKPYQTSAELVDYYDPEQKTVTVELDPSLSPSENAQANFKKYNKAKAGKNAALSLRIDIKAELAYLETVAANIENIEDLSALAEIKTELVEQGCIKEKIRGKQKKVNTAESLPLEFKSPDGLTIWVGKNNKQNDWLTLKKAKPNDLWLHVKDIPGSHVIVRAETAEIPDRTLEQAAELAAYFSKARTSSTVPVDYTQRKNVHKPNGAKPGMVIYENQRTIYVTPPKGISD